MSALTHVGGSLLVRDPVKSFRLYQRSAQVLFLPLQTHFKKYDSVLFSQNN